MGQQGACPPTAVRESACLPASCATAVLEAAEADLDDLADMLHDGPVQALVAARYAADAAVRGGDTTAARDAVQQALVELRRVLWGLRPRGASGLVAAIEQLSVQRLAAGQTTIELTGDADLTGAGAVLAYRLVQRVAGLRTPQVDVQADAATVVVDVHGAELLTSPERWVRRAEALGGALTVAGSAPGSPGSVRLALPADSDIDTDTDTRAAS